MPVTMTVNRQLSTSTDQPSTVNRQPQPFMESLPSRISTYTAQVLILIHSSLNRLYGTPYHSAG